VEIHGDKGFVILKENKIERLMINGEEQPVDASGASGTANDPAAVKSDGHRRQITNFVCAIRGEEELVMDCREGKKTICLIENIYGSEKANA
jgi:predicted dehydrogenase